MAKKDESGPAFPLLTQIGVGPVHIYQHGMTLRDYFAAQALNGMISSESNGIDRTKVNKETWARVAYEFAGAMLAAREGK